MSTISGCLFESKAIWKRKVRTSLRVFVIIPNPGLLRLNPGRELRRIEHMTVSARNCIAVLRCSETAGDHQRSLVETAFAEYVSPQIARNFPRRMKLKAPFGDKKPKCRRADRTARMEVQRFTQSPDAPSTLPNPRESFPDCTRNSVPLFRSTTVEKSICPGCRAAICGVSKAGISQERKPDACG